MKSIRSLLKHITGGGKSLIRKKSILISSLAVLVLAGAVGVVLHNHKSSAFEAQEYTDPDTSIRWVYTIDTEHKNSPATEVYINMTKNISSDITVPESFSDSYGTHFVTSIGMANLSDRDSFFSILPSAHSLTLTLTTAHTSNASTTSSVLKIPVSMKSQCLSL